MGGYQRGGRTKTGGDLNFTNGKVSVGNTSTLILAENLNRKAVNIVNDSDETIYLGIGENAVMNEGVRLNNSGGVYYLVGPDIHPRSISGISASGSKNVTFTEGE